MNALPTIDLQTLMEANEKIEWLSEKIAQLEDEIRKVKSGKSGWVTLDEAKMLSPRTKTLDWFLNNHHLWKPVD